MDEYDLGSAEFFAKYGGGRPTKYWVVSKSRPLSKRYPPAAVAQAALGWSDINGGYAKADSACRVLERAGFVIVDSAGRPIDSESVQALAEVELEQTIVDISTTERDQIVKARVGQDIFRKCLIELRGGECEVSGLNDSMLLRASHIKPWAKCDAHERLDPENGILLSSLWDAAFDAGLATFNKSGEALLSASLSRNAVALLKATVQMSLWIEDRRESYLEWHRTNLFKP